MSAILRILENGVPQQTVPLPAGQELVIGRNPQCDVPVPADPLLSSRHLAVCWQGGVCRIRDLGSTNGTRLNGLPVSLVEVSPGGVFSCGSTQFRYELSEVSAPMAAGAGGVAFSERQRYALRLDLLPPHLQRTVGFLDDSADRLLGKFRLRLSIPLTAEAGETPDAFLQRLVSLPAKLEFLAYSLPARTGVWWLLGVADALVQKTPEEQHLAEQIAEWVRRPVDGLRREIWTIGQEEAERRPFRWAANAVYFSGESIAPPNAPPLQPPEKILGKNILAGIEIACLTGHPAGISERRKSAFDAGLKAGLEGIPREFSGQKA